MKDSNTQDRFRQWANAYKVDPRAEVWERLESRLDSNIQHRKISMYRRWAIAASVAAVLLAGLGISHMWNHNQLNYAYAMIKPAAIEDLPSCETGIYDIVKSRQLYMSYGLSLKENQ